MDQTTQILALILAAVVGLSAVILILRRERVGREQESATTEFAASTEGSKRCPTCGMGNLWTDATCISCGGRLPG